MHKRSDIYLYVWLYSFKSTFPIRPNLILIIFSLYFIVIYCFLLFFFITLTLGSALTFYYCIIHLISHNRSSSLIFMGITGFLDFGTFFLILRFPLIFLSAYTIDLGNNGWDYRFYRDSNRDSCIDGNRLSGLVFRILFVRSGDDLMFASDLLRFILNGSMTICL